MVMATIPQGQRLRTVFTTVKGAAGVLGISEDKLLKMVRAGEVKGERVGWMWLIHRDELERLAASLGITATDSVE